MLNRTSSTELNVFDKRLTIVAHSYLGTLRIIRHSWRMSSLITLDFASFSILKLLWDICLANTKRFLTKHCGYLQKLNQIQEKPGVTRPQKPYAPRKQNNLVEDFFKHLLAPLYSDTSIKIDDCKDIQIDKQNNRSNLEYLYVEKKIVLYKTHLNHEKNRHELKTDILLVTMYTRKADLQESHLKKKL